MHDYYNGEITTADEPKVFPHLRNGFVSSVGQDSSRRWSLKKDAITPKPKTFFMKEIKILIAFWSAILQTLQGDAQINNPAGVEADFVIKDFKFESGETLSKLNIHYTTVGRPSKDNKGNIVNAILIMHGTQGGGYQFFFEQFASNLYNRAKYWILQNTLSFCRMP